MASKNVVKKKEKKNIIEGDVHVKATFNNTLICFTERPSGNVISWSSSGVKGFKGARKSTPFAAQSAAEDAGRKAQEHGLQKVDVYIKGPGSGRESALRALQAIGLTISSIKDITPIPRNGCKPRKKRRS